MFALGLAVGFAGAIGLLLAYEAWGNRWHRIPWPA